MEQERARIAILHLLESACKRNAMYFNPVDGVAALNFVMGVMGAADALGVSLPREKRDQVIEQRGWQYRPVGLVAEMKERGMSDEAAADEILAIEVETWRLCQSSG